MATATGTTVKESDGQSVTLSLSYSVVKNQIAVVSGWIGIAARDADSGDDVALTIKQDEYQIKVPSAYSGGIGDILYIDSADLTGHTPDDTAYGTSAGAGKIAAFKQTSAKDANDVITAIFLGQLLS